MAAEIDGLDIVIRSKGCIMIISDFSVGEHHAHIARREILLKLEPLSVQVLEINEGAESQTEEIKFLFVLSMSTSRELFIVKAGLKFNKVELCVFNLCQWQMLRKVLAKFKKLRSVLFCTMNTF